jgi:hypothetical protein
VAGRDHHCWDLLPSYTYYGHLELLLNGDETCGSQLPCLLIYHPAERCLDDFCAADAKQTAAAQPPALLQRRAAQQLQLRELTFAETVRVHCLLALRLLCLHLWVR